MHVRLLKKNEFVKNVGPRLFCVLTYCVETVKTLDYIRYSQLTRWCRGNASTLSARGSRVPFLAPAKLFMLDFNFCVFTFHNFCNLFCNVNLLSIY